MRIKQMLGQHRRDFNAIYECEHCGHEHEGSGYDDGYFHNNVIPARKCKKCGKTSDDDYAPRETKYPAGYVI